MLKPKRRIAVGLLLLAIALVGLAFAAGRERLLETRRHVVVKIFNVDGIGQIFVNCHLAVRLESGESGKKVEVGWLPPDDRIFLSATSIDGNPAWGFSGTTNGGFLFDESRGNTELPKLATPANRVVFAKAFLANGTELGALGCQPPNVVGKGGFAAAEGYASSPDDKNVTEVMDPRSSYRRPSGFYDFLDAVGGWSLIALAALGVLAAPGTKEIRAPVWSRIGVWRLFAAIAVTLGLCAAISALFGRSALYTTLTVAGILMLLASATFLILSGRKPCCPEGRRASTDR